ncbi:hypothetical protein C1C98_02300 [Pseudomonas ogarae]|uniref:Uncharacterized protein n=1 Tax=Pseudomonas ogarae (strain DSM 112162 / CECT 30235 / F113) TaxID=1114970 RepID=A0ABM6QT67_PSEO1|nr:hypothetical protein C1C98_02300 [Pseudomonas ogarae]
MWEQSLLAIQAPRYSRDRGVFIAGKPCSHNKTVPTGVLWCCERCVAPRQIAPIDKRHGSCRAFCVAL